MLVTCLVVARAEDLHEGTQRVWCSTKNIHTHLLFHTDITGEQWFNSQPTERLRGTSSGIKQRKPPEQAVDGEWASGHSGNVTLDPCARYRNAKKSKNKGDAGNNEDTDGVACANDFDCSVAGTYSIQGVDRKMLWNASKLVPAVGQCTNAVRAVCSLPWRLKGSVSEWVVVVVVVVVVVAAAAAAVVAAAVVFVVVVGRGSGSGAAGAGATAA